jgi:predicted ATPase
MLQSLSLYNYKNLHFPEPFALNSLNILIGPNGSGKSNFVAALQFLRDALAPSGTWEVGDEGFEKAILELGERKILTGSLSLPEQVGFEYVFVPDEHFHKGICYRLNLEVTEQVGVRIHSESLSDAVSDQDEPFYYFKCHDRHKGECAVSMYTNPGVSPQTRFETFQEVSTRELGLAALPVYLEESSHPPEYTPFYKVRRRLVEMVRKWHFYNANNMNLSKIRQAEPKIGQKDIFLAPNGENLPLVVDNLFQKHLDFEESLNLAMKSILPETRRVRPVRTGRLGLSLEWYFSGQKEPFFLSELSDGTVRMLCWAVVLLSPEQPAMLVLDEPELGLHPAWMQTLAQWIERMSGQTQVVVSTHSPDLLDRFTGRINDVICFCTLQDGLWSPSRLEKEFLDAKMSEGWELGDLYRVGDPLVGGWPW